MAFRGASRLPKAASHHGTAPPGSIRLFNTICILLAVYVQSCLYPYALAVHTSSQPPPVCPSQSCRAADIHTWAQFPLGRSGRYYFQADKVPKPTLILATRLLKSSRHAPKACFLHRDKSNFKKFGQAGVVCIMGQPTPPAIEAIVSLVRH